MELQKLRIFKVTTISVGVTNYRLMPFSRRSRPGLISSDSAEYKHAFGAGPLRAPSIERRAA